MVANPIINLPFGDVLYYPFMMNLGIVFWVHRIRMTTTGSIPPPLQRPGSPCLQNPLAGRLPAQQMIGRTLAELKNAELKSDFWLPLWRIDQNPMNSQD